MNLRLNKIMYINSLRLSVCDKAWEGRARHGLGTSTGGNWARTGHGHGHGLGTGTGTGGTGHGLGTDWARD
jgi:hypothetical protein